MFVRSPLKVSLGYTTITKERTLHVTIYSRNWLKLVSTRTNKRLLQERD